MGDPSVGPDVAFQLARVKFLETISSQTPSNYREISRKFVISNTLFRRTMVYGDPHSLRICA